MYLHCHAPFAFAENPSPNDVDDTIVYRDHFQGQNMVRGKKNTSYGGFDPWQKCVAPHFVPPAGVTVEVAGVVK